MNKTLAPPLNSAITPEEWQQIPANVRNWIGELVADNNRLREMVAYRTGQAVPSLLPAQ